ALWQFVRSVYGLTVPRRAVCPGHAAPMAYLERAILKPGRDLVVWACRGGAKTELGSVAAHLDSILRPGCQTRILGGSLDQSEKMYESLMRKWDGLFSAMLARNPTARRTDLVNGSAIEVLTQSARSVRGQRVHRLKCDEVDEFSPEVWQAAQFVTQSGPGRDGAWIPAQMEVFSTMHRPFGPMATLVDRLTTLDTPTARSGPALLVWCLWEVIERCGPEWSCSRCPLWSDCGGRAREAEGYFPIEDALAQKSRASRAAWEAEMLCQRPRADSLVFAEFDPARHVAPVRYDPALPLYRAIDFGYANPFVCLWVQVKDCGLKGKNDHVDDVDLSGVQLRVIGEYVERERPVSEHARKLAALDPGPVAATYADPAGWQRSDVTGTGPCQELARLGIRVRTPRAGILEGVEMVRRLLKERPLGAVGGPTGLVIEPSCRWLVRAFQEYHWDRSGDERRNERPAKDGADHPIDALRYLVTGLFLRRGGVKERRW
ncbi:MAG TPA: hypothetical protein VMY69_04685, partial [Phycisphaerae bacterium]|nr:hypothetical protein [Phycisphaerae bacterium]